MHIARTAMLGRTLLVVAGLGLVFGLAQQIRQKMVGRQSDGSVMLETNQRIKPAGRQVEFIGRPDASALSPDRRTLAVLNGYGKAIVLIDPEVGVVKQVFEAAGGSASFAGIAYSKDGKKLYASQANGKIIVANVAGDGFITLDKLIDSPKSPVPYPGREDQDAYPGGLALSADGKSLYVALSRNNTVGVLDLASGQFTGEIKVGNAPQEVLVVGNTAYVSNRGGRPAAAGDFTVDSSGTPIVADKNIGYATTGTVSVVDLSSAKETATIEVGMLPGAMLLEGTRLFVANANSDTVSVIDTTTNKVVRTLAVKPFAGALLGSSPNALAMIGENRLAVSLGRNNAVAVYTVPQDGSSATVFEGLIPTGFYPISLAADMVNGRLIVANGKGVGSEGPLAKVGPNPATNKTGKYVHSMLGSVSIVKIPSRNELRRYSAQVFANNGWNKITTVKADPSAKAVPIPRNLGEPSVFKHVVYIIKENRTYDQVLGDLPKGNGDPSLVQFGREVTPNHHALAEQFALLDNTYDSGLNSADGHQWTTQAFVNDYVEHSYGGFTRTYPFNGGDALVYTASGFIWDNALKHGKKVRNYGEYTNGLRADGIEMGPWSDGFLGSGKSDMGVWSDWYKDAQILAGKLQGSTHVKKLEAHSDVPSLDAITNRDYPPYHQVIPDQYRVEVFLKEFGEYVKNGNMPELVMMALTNDHTQGLAPNYPNPRSMVADNDLALGRVVEAISSSPYWKDTAIFVIEDDAQNGVDHVSGHRMPAFVISAYNRRGMVDSNYYTQIHIIRTMEQILGLPPMNQMDMAADPLSMSSLFSEQPDLTPYKALANQVPLDDINGKSAQNGMPAQWVAAMKDLDFSHPDKADEQILNRAIWYSVKGFNTPYPGDATVLSPTQVHPYLQAQNREVARRLDLDGLQLKQMKALEVKHAAPIEQNQILKALSPDRQAIGNGQ